MSKIKVKQNDYKKISTTDDYAVVPNVNCCWVIAVITLDYCYVGHWGGHEFRDTNFKDYAKIVKKLIDTEGTNLYLYSTVNSQSMKDMDTIYDALDIEDDIRNYHYNTWQQVGDTYEMVETIYFHPQSKNPGFSRHASPWVEYESGGGLHFRECTRVIAQPALTLEEMQALADPCPLCSGCLDCLECTIL